MVQNVGATFKSDSGTKRVAIAVGPTVIRGVSATQDGSSAIVLDLYHFDGLSERQVAAVSVPANSGTDGIVPAIDVLNDAACPWTEVDAQGNRIVRLSESESLRAAVATTPASGKRLDVVAFSSGDSRQ